MNKKQDRYLNIISDRIAEIRGYLDEADMLLDPDNAHASTPETLFRNLESYADYITSAALKMSKNVAAGEECRVASERIVSPEP
jgi:hypothetical protein